jgi:hypothetical protein
LPRDPRLCCPCPWRPESSHQSRALRYGDMDSILALYGSLNPTSVYQIGAVFPAFTEGARSDFVSILRPLRPNLISRDSAFSLSCSLMEERGTGGLRRPVAPALLHVAGPAKSSICSWAGPDQHLIHCIAFPIVTRGIGTALTKAQHFPGGRQVRGRRRQRTSLM